MNAEAVTPEFLDWLEAAPTLTCSPAEGECANAAAYLLYWTKGESSTGSPICVEHAREVEKGLRAARHHDIGRLFGVDRMTLAASLAVPR